MPVFAHLRFTRAWSWPALALLVCLIPARPAVAQAWHEREEAMHEAHVEELHELLEMLEPGIVATDRIGEHELRDALRELSEELRLEIEHAREARVFERERREHGDRMREREAHEREVLARERRHEAREREVLARERRHEAHERELLAREREREAHERERRALERERHAQARQEAHERRRAARERGREARAQQHEARPRGRARARAPRADGARAIAERRLEMIHMAMPALREAGHLDSAERLERAIRAAEVALADRRDPEARRVREGAPAPGEQIMLIMEASALWDEFGHETKAATLRAYADEMLAGRASGRRGPARNERRRADAPDPRLLERLEVLERRLDELEHVLRELDEPGRMR